MDDSTDIMFDDFLINDVLSVPLTYREACLHNVSDDIFNVTIDMLVKAQAAVDDGLLDIYTVNLKKFSMAVSEIVEVEPYVLIRSLIFKSAERTANSCQFDSHDVSKKSVLITFEIPSYYNEAYAYYKGAVSVLSSNILDKSLSFEPLIVAWAKVAGHLENHGVELRDYLLSLQHTFDNVYNSVVDDRKHIDNFIRFVDNYWMLFMVSIELTKRIYEHDCHIKFRKTATIDSLSEEFHISKWVVKNIWDYLMSRGVFDFSGYTRIIEVGKITSDIFNPECLWSAAKWELLFDRGIFPEYWKYIEKLSKYKFELELGRYVIPDTVKESVESVLEEDSFSQLANVVVAYSDIEDDLANLDDLL